MINMEMPGRAAALSRPCDDAAIAGPVLAQWQRLSGFWRGRLPAASRPGAVMLLGALGALALLLAFQQVVQGAVDRGELRRKAEARLVQATWRCADPRDATARAECLAGLDRARKDVNGPATLPLAATLRRGRTPP